MVSVSIGHPALWNLPHCYLGMGVAFQNALLVQLLLLFLVFPLLAKRSDHPGLEGAIGFICMLPLLVVAGIVSGMDTSIIVAGCVFSLGALVLSWAVVSIADRKEIVLWVYEGALIVVCLAMPLAYYLIYDMSKTEVSFLLDGAPTGLAWKLCNTLPDQWPRGALFIYGLLVVVMGCWGGGVAIGRMWRRRKTTDV